MKIKRMLVMLGLVGFTGASSYAMAQTYVFKHPSSGSRASGYVSQQVKNEIIEDEGIEEETDIACYDPANVGEVGTKGACSGMLIVDRNMLDAAINSGNLFLTKDGVEYTFGNSEHNIFTGQVTDMSSLFQIGHGEDNDSVYYFQEEIGYWDTSNVTNMRLMFRSAIFFDKDISSWNTAKVTDMFEMFRGGRFNQDIGNWDVSNVTNMRYMFSSSYFNKDISSWNTEKTTDMAGMFMSNQRFNQDLSDWCVSNIQVSTYFDSGANAWTEPKPAWGTCPRGEDQM